MGEDRGQEFTKDKIAKLEINYNPEFRKSILEEIEKEREKLRKAREGSIVLYLPTGSNCIAYVKPHLHVYLFLIYMRVPSLLTAYPLLKWYPL